MDVMALDKHHPYRAQQKSLLLFFRTTASWSATLTRRAGPAKGA